MRSAIRPVLTIGRFGLLSCRSQPARSIIMSSLLHKSTTLNKAPTIQSKRHYSSANSEGVFSKLSRAVSFSFYSGIVLGGVGLVVSFCFFAFRMKIDNFLTILN